MKTLCVNAKNYLEDLNANLTTFNLLKHMKMYEAMNMIRDAWANVSTSTISNCWIKSGIAGYWNIIKIAPQNKLNKLQEKQAIDYATSVFTDLDV